MSENTSKTVVPVTETMPCDPMAINFYTWAMPSTFGNAEAEEAAARLIFFSQREQEWVGIPWSAIAEMVNSEGEQMNKVSEAKRHNFEAQHAYNVAMWKRRRMLFLTLGLYALFVPKPTLDLKEVPDYQPPFSVALALGPQLLVNGFHRLMEKGYLRVERQETEGEEFDVMFPTPALAEQIMKVQHIQPN